MVGLGLVLLLWWRSWRCCPRVLVKVCVRCRRDGSRRYRSTLTLRRWPGTNSPHIRRGVIRRRTRSLSALRRRSLHRRVRLVRRPQTAPKRATLFLHFSFCRSRIRCTGRRISRERFSKHALAFLRRLHLRLRAVLSRYCPSTGKRTGIAGPRLEAFVQDLDKIGGKEADHAPVALQTPHPPRSVASIETFNEIALDKAQVTFRLESSELRAKLLPNVLPRLPMSKRLCTSMGSVWAAAGQQEPWPQCGV